MKALTWLTTRDGRCLIGLVIAMVVIGTAYQLRPSSSAVAADEPLTPQTKLPPPIGREDWSPLPNERQGTPQFNHAPPATVAGWGGPAQEPTVPKVWSSTSTIQLPPPLSSVPVPDSPRLVPISATLPSEPDRTVEQLLKAVEDIQAQKADLSRREKETLAILEKKLAEQREKLSKLKATADGAGNGEVDCH
jgi:hypothetical protein